VAKLDPPPDSDYLLLSDPIHLSYLANYWVDPISLGAGFLGYLLVRKDGHAKLLHDNRTPKSTQLAHAEEIRSIPWYDGQSPARGPRQLAVMSEVNPMRSGLRVHDRPGDPLASQLINTIADMRRQKDPDEIALLKTCMRATEAGHAWGRANIKAGMTELDVYSGVSAACMKTAGMPVIVYGDFAVSGGPNKRGGGSDRSRSQGRRHDYPRLFRRHPGLSQRLHEHDCRRRQPDEGPAATLRPVPNETLN
jgi:Xaa-Pro aminopeptidase